jgi:hypothetical protein
LGDSCRPATQFDVFATLGGIWGFVFGRNHDQLCISALTTAVEGLVKSRFGDVKIRRWYPRFLLTTNDHRVISLMIHGMFGDRFPKARPQLPSVARDFEEDLASRGLTWIVYLKRLNQPGLC